MPFTLANCAFNLPAKFGNRQNLGFLKPGTLNASPSLTADGSLAMTSLVQALTELTETYEFEELKYQTPIPPAVPLSMTVGQPIISIASLLATIPTNTAYPQFQQQNVLDITDQYTFWMWFSGGVNQAGRYLDYRRVTTVDAESYGITSPTQGAIGTAPPAVYTRFGSNFQVGPAPDQTYQYFVRLKLRHPFPVNNFVPATLQATVSGGAVTAVTIVDGGSGYIPNSLIPLVFESSPIGTTARGNAGSSPAGVITVANLTSGASGYGTAPQVFTAVLATQQVFMPDSWQPKLEYMACRQLALWEGASEFLAMFEDELQRRGVDFNKARESKPQMERDERHNTRQLSMKTSKYTHS